MAKDSLNAEKPPAAATSVSVRLPTLSTTEVIIDANYADIAAATKVAAAPALAKRNTARVSAITAVAGEDKSGGGEEDKAKEPDEEYWTIENDPSFSENFRAFEKAQAAIRAARDEQEDVSAITPAAGEDKSDGGGRDKGKEHNEEYKSDHSVPFSPKIFNSIHKENQARAAARNEQEDNEEDKDNENNNDNESVSKVARLSPLKRKA